MNNLIISINKLSDTDVPGWVDCSLVDAFGNCHAFHEKLPIVSSENLSSESKYPCDGMIRCEISALSPGGPDAMVVVNTSVVDGVESVDGVSEFTVNMNQVISINE